MNTKTAIDPFREQQDKPVPKVMTIQQFCQQSARYDLEDVYQRGEVWTKAKQRALIESIVEDKPINLIHVVAKSKPSAASDWWVADGKQRLSTIKAFRDDELTVPVLFTPPRVAEEISKNMTYGQIARRSEEGDVTCGAIMRSFDEYNLHMYCYDPLTTAARMLLFSRINGGESLGATEKQYCLHARTKRFLEFLWEWFFKDKTLLVRALQRKTAQNELSRIIFVHKLLLLPLGTRLDDSFQVRDLGGASKDKALCNLEQQLELCNSPMESKFYEEDLDKLGPDRRKQIDVIRKACSAFNDMLRDKQTQNRMTDVWVSDCIWFFVQQMQKRVFTDAFVRENEKKLANMFFAHGTWNDTEGLSFSKSNTHVVKNIEARLSNLQCLLEAIPGLDIGVKMKGVTEIGRRESIRQAPDRDPVSGMPLTAENSQTDHVKPKSLFSTTEYQQLDKKTNLAKSNKTDFPLHLIVE
jgi:hypothetical protein